MYLIHFPEAFPRGAKEEDIMSGKKQPASITIKKTWEMMEVRVIFARKLNDKSVSGSRP